MVENSRYRKISTYFMEGRNLKNCLKHVLIKVLFYKYFQHSMAGKQEGNSQIKWCSLRKVAKKNMGSGV
jgi:hypothetical protein